MKFLFPILIVFIAHSLLAAPNSMEQYVEGRLCVVTPTKRIVPVSAVYGFDYLAQETRKANKIRNENEEKEKEEEGIRLRAFDTNHPVFPFPDQWEEIASTYIEGDIVGYFKGLDSGWVILRKGEVFRIWVTNHEY